MHFLKPLRPHRPARGFTLVELAVVLLVVTVLAAVLLVPLSGREEVRRRHETGTTLKQIREALIGFAIVYKRFPCPTFETDPTDPDYGREATPPCPQGSEGYLPWRTLSVPPFDAWGAPRLATGDPWTGYWRYRADAGFAPAPGDISCPWPIEPVSASTPFVSRLTVEDSSGQELTVSSGSAPACPTGEETRKMASALVYSTGPNRVADGQNASYEATGTAVYEQDDPGAAFDDMLIWIGKPLLIGRMGAAGSL